MLVVHSDQLAWFKWLTTHKAFKVFLVRERSQTTCTTLAQRAVMMSQPVMMNRVQTCQPAGLQTPWRKGQS